ncbi:MAG: OPT/YSL family transporter [Negativicutes bacterium]|jgi:uncharacterized oligopeptide transporter (OPT) family protein
MKNSNVPVLLIAIVGAVAISLSSLYVALKLGALPWPTVFAALSAYGLLRLLKRPDINEANCAQAAISAGGLVAGGLAFTLPALWMLQADASISRFEVTCLALAGGLAGWFFASILRHEVLDKQQMPFPMGQAAAEVLESSAGGAHSRLLFSSLFVAGAVTLMRDWLKLFPAALIIPIRSFPVGIWISPMAVGVGYVLGAGYCLYWAGGMVAGVVWMIASGNPEALFIKNSAGIGLITGGGIGTVLINLQFSRAKMQISARKRDWLILAAAYVLLGFSGLGWLATLLLIVVTFIACRIAMQLTGQTAINPMDLLGLMTVLIMSAIFNLAVKPMIMTAVVAAVACAVAGDTLQDLKSGLLLGTSQRKQLRFALLGTIVGALVASAAILILHEEYGVFGGVSEFAAPQAAAIAAMLGGEFHSAVFFGALVLGVSGVLFKQPMMLIGLGVYLPTPLSAAIVLGGVVSYIAKCYGEHAERQCSHIAAGCLGGEGIAGMLYALFRAVSG